MIKVHLVKKDTVCRFLCGADFSSRNCTYPSRETGFSTILPLRNPPTCETCILLHWLNPEETEYLEN